MWRRKDEAGKKLSSMLKRFIFQGAGIAIYLLLMEPGQAICLMD